MRLKGKTALITGGASGFGAGIARRFQAEGAKVMVADINPGTLRAFGDETGCLTVEADVGRPESVAEMAEAVRSELGPLDILINNAGVTHLPAEMQQVSEDDFDRVYQVNMKAIYLAARCFVPEMKSRRTGSIINIASAAGVRPRAGLAWYSASKGWVITATKAMADELASFNVRVNALVPAAGDTPLLPSFMGEDTPEMRAKFLSSIPMGRFTTAEDLAGAALYLCSEDAAIVTGVALEIDGGRCL